MAALLASLITLVSMISNPPMLSAAASLQGIPKRKLFRTGNRINRVVCVSDVHTDYQSNMDWVRGLVARPDTLLIVAGDISHRMSVIRETLRTLRRTFGEVLYTPGNHDLWIDDSVDSDGTVAATRRDSVGKLRALYELCDEEGIHTGPVRIGGDSESLRNDGYGSAVGLWIVPLLSWHHASFDTEPDIDPDCWSGIPSIKFASDFRKAKWPAPLSPYDESVAEFFDCANDVLLGEENTLQETIREDDVPVMTVSHFLPRIELTPEKRYLFIPTLNKVVGSRFLDARIRSLGSVFHVFGHTHFGWDQKIDGVRYVQCALAYPQERKMRPDSLKIGTMEHDMENNGVGDTGRLEPVCIWAMTEDAGRDRGFPAENLGGSWSERYSIVPRRPEMTDTLAPWVAHQYKRGKHGKIEHYVSHNKNYP